MYTHLAMFWIFCVGWRHYVNIVYIKSYLTRVWDTKIRNDYNTSTTRVVMWYSLTMIIHPCSLFCLTTNGNMSKNGPLSCINSTNYKSIDSGQPARTAKAKLGRYILQIYWNCISTSITPFRNRQASIRPTVRELENTCPPWYDLSC